MILSHQSDSYHLLTKAIRSTYTCKYHLKSINFIWVIYAIRRQRNVWLFNVFCSFIIKTTAYFVIKLVRVSVSDKPQWIRSLPLTFWFWKNAYLVDNDSNLVNNLPIIFLYDVRNESFLFVKLNVNNKSVVSFKHAINWFGKSRVFLIVNRSRINLFVVWDGGFPSSEELWANELRFGKKENLEKFKTVSKDLH